jgi:DNA repair protein RecO (recombination protein O)
MEVSQTEAVVLSCRDYGESDRLIAFYSETGGNLRGIAKGARRSKKRFVHTFEPCSLVRLTYRVRKGLVWIEAGSLLEPHLSLRTDLMRGGCGAAFGDCPGNGSGRGATA